jgi:acyl-CoA dehydrogenase
VPIGRFEGVEEALARIGGMTYLMEAARCMTAGAVDLGEKPSVPSAIVKYHLTEGMRAVLNDAMDVHGGKGICLGPNNYLGRAYQLAPVAITVEGANILTRSLIIFGQGAIRCHPWVLKEMEAANDPDPERGAAAFDTALWAHVRFFLANLGRSFFLGISGGRFTNVPGAPQTRRYFQQLNRFAAALALLSDMSMLVLGGELKRREKLSARLGDVLSQLYLCSAALKRFEDQGREPADLPLLTWALYSAFFKIQVAMDGVLANFPHRPLAWLLRLMVFPKGLTLNAPTDAMGHAVAQLLLAPSPARDRLTAGIYIPEGDSEIVGRLEVALEAVIEADAVKMALKRERPAPAGQTETAAIAAVARAEALTRAVIDVDDFAPEDLRRQPSAS